MPELPEVQTVVDDLNGAGIIGNKIQTAKVWWPATIAMLSCDDFSSRIEGMTLQAIDRRGKYIVIVLDFGWVLAVHLRMTGRFFLVNGNASQMPHVQVALEISDGRSLLLS